MTNPPSQTRSDVLTRTAIAALRATLDTATPGTPALAPGDEAHRRRITPDPVLLFRYSALTFNAHRIHYDQPYATAVEGYPGLVVHGPLIATLLADLLGSVWPGSALKRFAFKAIRPL